MHLKTAVPAEDLGFSGLVLGLLVLESGLAQQLGKHLDLQVGLRFGLAL